MGKQSRDRSFERRTFAIDHASSHHNTRSRSHAQSSHHNRSRLIAVCVRPSKPNAPSPAERSEGIQGEEFPVAANATSFGPHPLNEVREFRERAVVDMRKITRVRAHAENCIQQSTFLSRCSQPATQSGAFLHAIFGISASSQPAQPTANRPSQSTQDRLDSISTHRKPA